MISLVNQLNGPWEKVRGSLSNDLKHIQAAMNVRWGHTFGNDNLLQVGTIGGDGTIASRYVANTGTGNAPTWDRINLSNGVKSRLPYANFIASTAASRLVGRESGSAGDFEEISLAANQLAISTTTLGLAGPHNFTTQTSHGVLYGAATSAIAATAEGATGTVLIGTTGNVPSFAALSGLAVTSIAGTANQITTSASVGAVTLSLPTTVIGVTTIVGAAAVGSSLSLQSTSAVGTTDFIKFLVGNNGATEALRIIHSGNVGIGVTAPANTLEVGTAFVVKTATSNQVGINTAPTGSHILDVDSKNAAGVVAIAAGDVNGTGSLFYLGSSGANTETVINSRNNQPLALWVNNTEYVRILTSGRVGINLTAPTAVLHLRSGTTAASTAPLKFTSGSLLTTAEAGGVEFLTDAYYGTITTGAARKTFAFLESPTFTTPVLGVASGTSVSLSGTVSLANTGGAAASGQLTLVLGTKTVNTTAATGTCLIFFQRVTAGGTIGFATTYTVVANTSFTVSSDSALDTSVYNWWIVETH